MPPPRRPNRTAIQHPLEPAAEAPTAADAPPSGSGCAGRLDAAGTCSTGKLADWLMPDKLMRRLVATVDNLPRNVRIEPLRPLRAPSKPFAVERETLDAAAGTERITIAPAQCRAL